MQRSHIFLFLELDLNLFDVICTKTKINLNNFIIFSSGDLGRMKDNLVDTLYTLWSDSNNNNNKNNNNNNNKFKWRTKLGRQLGGHSLHLMVRQQQQQQQQQQQKQQ